MQKLLLLTTLCLFLGCKKTAIQIEYEAIQNVWYIESTEQLPNVGKEIQFINFDACKVTKKKSQIQGFGCLAPINQREIDNSIALSFSIMPNKIMKISSVMNTRDSQTEFLGMINESEMLKKLKQELEGEWAYEVNSNKMTLTRSNYKIVFKL